MALKSSNAGQPSDTPERRCTRDGELLACETHTYVGYMAVLVLHGFFENILQVMGIRSTAQRK